MLVRIKINIHLIGLDQQWKSSLEPRNMISQHLGIRPIRRLLQGCVQRLYLLLHYAGKRHPVQSALVILHLSKKNGVRSF